jgi:hypothetical protein
MGDKYYYRPLKKRLKERRVSMESSEVPGGGEEE